MIQCRAGQSQFQKLFVSKKEKIVTEIKQEHHGRKEERYVFQLKAKFSDELVEKWPTIRSIIALERHRSINGQCIVETSYYINSMSPKNKMLGHYIRQHYILDAVFKEDNSRIALDGAIKNIALFRLRRFVMNMVKLSRQIHFLR